MCKVVQSGGLDKEDTGCEAVKGQCTHYVCGATMRDFGKTDFYGNGIDSDENFNLGSACHFVRLTFSLAAYICTYLLLLYFLH